MARSRPLVFLALAALALTPAAFAEVASLSWRALYAGALGSSQVTVDLSVYSDGGAFARLWQTGLSSYLSGHGSMADGDLSLSFYLPRALDALAWEAESVLLDAALQAAGPDAEPPYDGYEVAPFGAVVAQLSGQATVAWDADFDPITATLSFTDAAPFALGGPTEGAALVPGDVHDLTLARVALHSSASLTQGRIGARTSFPYFLRGELTAVNPYLESRQRVAADEFVAYARATLAEGGGWGMEFDEDVFVTGTAAGFVSLLGYTYTYTGGAHGNTFAEAYVLEVGEAGLKRWQTADLFAADVDWAEQVGPLVLERLAAMGAMWVTEGDVVEVTERDLRVATLEPGGLTFHFDPYHMGPYVQGSFAVTLPYALVSELAVADGPLAAFARAFGD